MGVVAGGAARCPSSEAEMYGSNTPGTAQVSALRSSEASAPQGFKCISIMGDSNGGSATSALGAVSFLGRVLGGSTV